MARRKWDIFVSHASEDKDTFVRPFVRRLLELGLSVWYDEFQLLPGDSLRRSIDEGLARSEYVVAVLSPSFFRKKWTQNELSAIFARESGEKGLIIPVWFGVSPAQVKKFSPMLADRLAVTKPHPLDAAGDVFRVLRRQPPKVPKTEVNVDTQTTINFKIASDGAAHELTHSISGPIKALVPFAADFMRDRIQNNVGAVGLASVITHELLVNAIAHRDYSNNEQIYLTAATRSIKVSSPGKLLAPLTIENLKRAHGAIARNPKLAHELYDLGYMELMGAGLHRLHYQLKESGWPALRFHQQKGRFIAEIRLPTNAKKS